MNPPPLRGALIGCGDIARTHLSSFRNLGIELVALCDLDRGRAEARREEYASPETKILTDYREVMALPGLDFVTVATPVAGHAPITVAALKAGKHVACEKPSALEVRENVAIRDAAKEAGRKVIFFSSRMRPGYAEMAKKFIDDGDLGQIYRVDVQYYRRRGRPGIDCVVHAKWFLNSLQAGGGVIMDMGQYFLDQVLNLVGWPSIEAVSATTFRGHDHDLPAGTVFDVEEHCTLLARAAGGISLTCDFAWIAHHTPKRCITILGTKGGLRMEDGSPLTYFSNKGGPWRWVNTTPEWEPKEKGGDVIYANFFRAIRGEEVDIGTTPDQAILITELTQMALKSAKLGREVKREEIL